MKTAEEILAKRISVFPSDENMTDEAIKRNVIAAMEEYRIQDIDAYMEEFIKAEPVKFVQFALVLIGRDIFESNAETFTFSQEGDIKEGRRFKISVRGKIKEIKNLKSETI